MADTSTEPTAGPGLTRRRAMILALPGVLVLAFGVGTLNPHTSVTTAFCDTTRESLRCFPNGDESYVVVHRDGLWQDADHVWRRGRPDCLQGTDDAAGPVRLAVVAGEDDGMAWEQVVWVGCP
jgi:hypothetical protein